MRQAENSRETNLAEGPLPCERNWHVGETNLVVGGRFETVNKVEGCGIRHFLLERVCGSDC